MAPGTYLWGMEKKGAANQPSFSVCLLLFVFHRSLSIDGFGWGVVALEIELMISGARLQFNAKNSLSLKHCLHARLLHGWPAQKVRNMSAVLFMVGAGHEAPDIIDTLLNVDATPRKPNYTMASGPSPGGGSACHLGRGGGIRIGSFSICLCFDLCVTPSVFVCSICGPPELSLVLWDCGYEDTFFRYEAEAHARLAAHFDDLVTKVVTRSILWVGGGGLKEKAEGGGVHTRCWQLLRDSRLS